MRCRLSSAGQSNRLVSDRSSVRTRQAARGLKRWPVAVACLPVADRARGRRTVAAAPRRAAEVGTSRRYAGDPEITHWLRLRRHLAPGRISDRHRPVPLEKLPPKLLSILNEK